MATAEGDCLSSATEVWVGPVVSSTYQMPSSLSPPLFSCSEIHRKIAIFIDVYVLSSKSGI